MNSPSPAPSSARVLLAVLVPMLALVACDRRAQEDDTTATPADTELARPADTGAPPAPTPGTEATAASGATSTEPPPDADDVDVPAPGEAAALSQADALALLITLNEHEIAAADQAARKKVTGPVLEFANMMRTDHSKNLEETTRLGGAASTATAVTTLRSQGEDELRRLDAQEGKAYEKAYVEAMVKGHADALTLLDGKLLPAATDDKVRQHFTATRAAVARHLERAKLLPGAGG